MDTEVATSSRVLNEFRKLFQKNDEWTASICRNGTSLEISISDRHLTASWSQGGYLPYSCTDLLKELGWECPGNGSYEDGLFKVKIYPKGN
jgi:hypothetical protein